jgi:hypothetical protein
MTKIIGMSGVNESNEFAKRSMGKTGQVVIKSTEGKNMGNVG